MFNVNRVISTNLLDINPVNNIWGEVLEHVTLDVFYNTVDTELWDSVEMGINSSLQIIVEVLK